LTKNPAERYATAGELADDLRRWLADQAIKAKPPALRLRAARWARRHVAAVAATIASLFVILTIAGVMAGWWAKDRALRQTETGLTVRAALDEADQLQAARKTTEALARVRQATSVLAAGVATLELQRTVNARLTDLTLAAELEEIRIARAAICFSQRDSDTSSVAAEKQLAHALRAYGVDIDALSVEQAAERIRAGTVAIEIAGALDDWSTVVNGLRPADTARRNRLFAIGRLADPDSVRCRIRQTLEKGDLEALKLLAFTEPVAKAPPATVVTLATALGARCALNEGVELLRQAQLRHPTDFGINLLLGTMLNEKEFPYIPVPMPTVLESPKNHDIIRYFSVACALRPDSPVARVSLGYALSRAGQLPEAEANLRVGLRLKPDDERAQFELAQMTRSPSDRFRQWREVLRINPNNANAQINLCFALQAEGRLDDAIAEYRAAIQRNPSEAAFHSNLGRLLKKTGRLDEAIASHQKAVSFAPQNTNMRANLCVTLVAKSQFDEAIAELREGLRLNPESALLNSTLAWVLSDCPSPHHRDYREALERASKAVAVAPKSARERHYLGVARYRNGNWAEAVDALMKSVELAKGENAAFNYFFLAMARQRLDEKQQARDHYDRAVEWMDKHQPKDEELLRYRAEATELLGITGSRESRKD
jgi:tetratricopeptide (TPR) repeat protein